ncbi:hypothetical protein BDB00DRAFT_755309 [Zychaea mexicana]|uniref:uncharacterized protein n=1 Tax=Zychaea mexicana TaxID=64656 RepID=UPI0022FDFF13|nr:uncharacterized protein BDB00DRAFT_755309 [Zychaea mexicana]KAI9498046.1 hypothetical protein BDB00DRAFT_755309 [Zychaea mexicana]
MSLHVNFSTHGQDLKNAYNAVLSDSDPTDWLIYSYDKGTNDIRVQGTGDGGLEELNDEFSDGKIQFAYARVLDPNTELPKYVFIAWCGSGVPETRKGFFNSHLVEVSNFFKSFHVQINARDEADVEPELIVKRVSESSGAKYSVHKEQRRAQPAVTPVGSVYKKTEVPDIAAMQRESMKKDGPPAPVGTNYKPVSTAPKPLASRWNAATQQQDSGAAAVRAEREKAEREAREREEQSARDQLERNRAGEEQERQRLAQEEQDSQQRAAAAREAASQREREAAAAAAAQREQEEAQQRQQQQQEAEQARLHQEQEQREAEAAEQRRREEQEAKRQRLKQQQLEDERREQEEQEAAAATRQAEQEATLHNQLDETADRAVHSATHAASAAIAGDGQDDGAQGVSAVVLFNYAAGEANEMTLVEGEVIGQIDQVDEGWWFGVSEDGKKQGLFPANYVQLLEEEEQQQQQQQPQAAAAAAPAAPAASVAANGVQSPPAAKQDQGNTAIALYDYAAGEDNEISFKENQLITHIEFVSDDWWQGVAADGKSVGLFPGKEKTKVDREGDHPCFFSVYDELYIRTDTTSTQIRIQ